MILSSRCGRGRLFANRQTISRDFCTSDCRNFVLALFEMLRRFRNRVALDQNIFAAEFVLRIASFRRVAVRLHAVMKFENLSGIAQRFVDFVFRSRCKMRLLFVAALC